MNKKLIGIIVAVVVLVGGGLFLLFWHNSSAHATALDSLTTKQALALPNSTACLANNTSVKKHVESLPGLSENAGPWTIEINDVPAGTNVDVNVATYSGANTVTGSLIYPKKYGSYNYTLTKQSNGWVFTQFTGCH